MTTTIIRQDGAFRIIRDGRGPPGPRGPQELVAFVQGLTNPTDALYGVASYPVGDQPRHFRSSASRADADAVATSTTVFPIKKNGVQVGTFTFTAGTSVAVVDLDDADGDGTDGDVFGIFGPITPDATLRNIRLVLGEA